MNILHLRASNFYGGPERQLHLHAILARGCGFSVTIGSFTEKGRAPEFLQAISNDNISTYVFDSKNSYDFKVVGKLRKFLMENKIDILCTHDYRTLVAGCLARRGTKTGWVAFSRGWTEENFKVRLFHSIDKFIIRYADHVVAVSESQRERLLKLSVPEKKISVVHNAFDLGIIDSVTRIDLRQKFSLPSNAIVCLSAGRFSHEKGQQFLVEAANIAVKENGRLYFIMYGDGPELSRVREMAGKSEYHDHIICPGFEKYLLGCLKGADILVNPSLSEGLPNIVLEGMALGVPVVATAVGGVPELVRHLENGILVAPGESQSLAEGILTMAGKDVSIARITKAALSTVREQYSFEKQMNELADVYRIFEEKKRY